MRRLARNFRTILVAPTKEIGLKALKDAGLDQGGYNVISNCLGFGGSTNKTAVILGGPEYEPLWDDFDPEELRFLLITMVTQYHAFDWVDWVDNDHGYKKYYLVDN